MPSSLFISTAALLFQTFNYPVSLKSLTLNSDGTFNFGVCTLKMMSKTTMMIIARITQKSLKNCFTCEKKLPLVSETKSYQIIQNVMGRNCNVQLHVHFYRNILNLLCTCRSFRIE